MDDPLKVIKVIASDGKTGEQRELSYTNCKVIGNGSFGVVFQARVVSGGNGNLVEGAGSGQDGGAASDAPKESQEDVAIKKVLQDKRFKVRKYTIAERSEQS
jgi:glycogen synthase kinase 3 beta